jgi:hypothetical protein
MPWALNPSGEVVDEMVASLLINIVGRQLMVRFMAREHVKRTDDDRMAHRYGGSNGMKISVFRRNSSLDFKVGTGEAGALLAGYRRDSPGGPLCDTSSSGWRKTSRTCRRNSGRSSRKSMPWCASDTSPGMGRCPPPIRPTSEIV